MAASLRNVTTSDAYTDAATVHQARTIEELVQVANATVAYQIDEDPDGLGRWSTPERFLNPSMGPLGQRCAGIRFRSWLAGVPAQVSADLYTEDELSGSAILSPFTSHVDPSGAIGVKVPGAELAYVEFVANVATTLATEAAPLTIVETGNITLDGDPILVEFYCPEWAMGGVAVSAINLWRDLADIGRIATRQIVSSTAGYPVRVTRKLLTPGSGPHNFLARLWTSAGANSVVGAGAGGVGVQVPGFIRVTRV